MTLTAIVACVHSPDTARVSARYPDSTFETRMQGCSVVGPHARRFDRDLRSALLVGREEVRNAKYFPCTALVVATAHGIADHVLYRLSLSRDGRYEEKQLEP